MQALTLGIALVALALAWVAYARTGGLTRLHQQADDMRARTANLLDRVEHALRPTPDEDDHHDDDELTQVRRAREPQTPRAS